MVHVDVDISTTDWNSVTDPSWQWSMNKVLTVSRHSNNGSEVSSRFSSDFSNNWPVSNVSTIDVFSCLTLSGLSFKKVLGCDGGSTRSDRIPISLLLSYSLSIRKGMYWTNRNSLEWLSYLVFSRLCDFSTFKLCIQTLIPLWNIVSFQSLQWYTFKNLGSID